MKSQTTVERTSACERVLIRTFEAHAGPTRVAVALLVVRGEGGA